MRAPPITIFPAFAADPDTDLFAGSTGATFDATRRGWRLRGTAFDSIKVVTLAPAGYAVATMTLWFEDDAGTSNNATLAVASRVGYAASPAVEIFINQIPMDLAPRKLTLPPIQADQPGMPLHFAIARNATGNAADNSADAIYITAVEISWA